MADRAYLATPGGLRHAGLNPGYGAGRHAAADRGDDDRGGADPHGGASSGYGDIHTHHRHANAQGASCHCDADAHSDPDLDGHGHKYSHRHPQAHFAADAESNVDAAASDGDPDGIPSSDGYASTGASVLQDLHGRQGLRGFMYRQG